MTDCDLKPYRTTRVLVYAEVVEETRFTAIITSLLI